MTSSSTSTSPIVKTAQGAVRGTQEAGISGFRGIPYAEPPVGQLRFRPPVVRQRWDGTRDATKFGEIVPQTDEAAGAFDKMLLAAGVPQGDDCLNLNVWTPDPGQTGLPVLVWIHGGSFLWGAGSNPVYDGATFAHDGVVTVTINYRLGASGFLYVGDRPGSGNFALLDQMAALRWVQENIAAFGGDPARITVAGESAGALCIGQLLAAPAARGLFRRAIMQSGGTHSHIGTEAASLVADEVLARLGVRLTDDDAIAAITSPQLLAAQMAAQPRATEVASNGVVSFDLFANRFVIFGPTSGTDVVPERALLPIGRGVAKDIDLLVGGNADEATFWIQSAEAAQGLVDVIEQVAGLVFSPSGRSGSEVLEHYRINRGSTDRADAVVPFASDLAFRIASIRLAETAQPHHPNVSMYRFAWKGRLGAAHALDLPFTFDNLEKGANLIAALRGEDAPQSLATTMHGAWVTFITTGSPQHPSLPEWPVYEPNRRATMQFDLESSVVDDPDGSERRLWDVVQF